MDTWLAVVAALLLALVAFRRARRVVTPDARREAAGRTGGERAGQFVTGVLAAARTGVGVAALVAIVWLALELFT